MEVSQELESLMDSHVDWAYLPPTAMHVIGTLLPSSSLLRARTVNKHWASCLAGVVDTIYIVPEYFLKDEDAQSVPKIFPKATTVNLDLQDTFMTVPEVVKESLERYTAERAVRAGPATSEEAGGSSSSSSAAASSSSQPEPSSSETNNVCLPSSSGGGVPDCATDCQKTLSPAPVADATSGPSDPATTTATAEATEQSSSPSPSSSSSGQPGEHNRESVQDQPPTPEAVAARPADLQTQPRGDQQSAPPAPLAPLPPPLPVPAQQQQELNQQDQQGAAQQQPPAPLAPQLPPLGPNYIQPPAPLEVPQHPNAAAAFAAFAAGLLNPNLENPAAANAIGAVVGGVVGGNAAAVGVHGPIAAAAAAAPQPPPTFPFSAISVDPLPSIFPAGANHLRIRLPDSHDIQSHYADLPACWDYVASLLGRVGPKLTGLSLSTAPDAAHVSMLSPLTQLTSLTMDEASHSSWSTEHLPIVGSLTNLCSLAIKIPPFRNTRPEAAGAAGVATQQPPAALSSWSALQRLTKLHVSALRYTYHASLVSVLPYLTKLEYLALRAPQTRLPWPGTDRPLFAHIGLLTGLTQLSLALGDHNMAPQDWQSLTTLGKLSAIEISVSEGSDGLNVPMGLDFPALRNLKLRYPNSQDLVRIAGWSGVCKLDIKFPEHEREWHQEDAVMELVEFRSKLPPTPGAAIIAAVLDTAPTAVTAAGVAAASAAAAAGGAGAGGAPASSRGPLDAVAAAAAAPGGVGVSAAALGAAAPVPAVGAAAGGPPMGAGNTVGLAAWWSPLLPLLALPNMTDFRCSAKEGLASRDPILFDEIVSGLSTSWPAITRLCFKGSINVTSQPAGWDALKALTRLQQLELRHHPPQEEGTENALTRAARNPRYLRVDPIKLPATSLPDSLQTLLLENVELRRKETDCLVNLTSLERRTTCRHFPEFVGMPLQRLVVSNCCVKAKGISSIAKECGGLTHLVFAVYKVTEPADMRELQSALKEMVTRLKQLQVLKVRVLAGCITQELVEDMGTHLLHLQRLKLTSSDGWADTSLFLPLTRVAGLRKCSLAYFKNAEAARLLRQEFRLVLPYCKIKAKHETV